MYKPGTEAIPGWESLEVGFFLKGFTSVKSISQPAKAHRTSSPLILAPWEYTQKPHTKKVQALLEHALLLLNCFSLFKSQQITQGSFKEQRLLVTRLP